MTRCRNLLVMACVLALAGFGVHASAAERFVDIAIDSPFDAVLLKNPLLMESGGGKVIINPDGTRLVVGVGLVAYDKKAPPQQRLNKERVARLKALRELTAQTSPIQIVHLERAAEASRLESIDGGEQRGRAIEEYLSVTTSQFEAVVKDLPVVGKWYSADGDILFIAIGKEFSALTIQE